jgi:phosphoribosyl 1,2-cyclic phosphate phosphodiesterase
MNFKFLGTADSAGIPVHNCTCSVCIKYRKKGIVNLATSAYIEIDDTIILIDAGVESISNTFDGKDIKSIFLTHFHADHCLGLLRLRHSKNEMLCYHPKDELGFSDLFKHKYSIVYKILKAFEKIEINQISFTSIPLIHSKNTLGYFIEYKNKSIAYLTDCSAIPFESYEFLKNKIIDYAFIDACYDESKIKGNHLNYLQASDILDTLNVKNGYLMHVSHTTKSYIEKNSIKLKYKYVEKNECFDL